MTSADKYRDSVRQLRFDKMMPGFDSSRALESLKGLRDSANADAALDRQIIGVEQYDAGDDARRQADIPKAGFNAAMGGDTTTKRMIERRRPVESDARFMSTAGGYGYDPNWGSPRLLGSGDTIGQGDTGFGSTDMANAQTEGASPLGQARQQQILDVLRRSRVSGY